MNDARATALVALRCLDLTSLNPDDGPMQVRALCERARAAAVRWAAPAAVCVWPRGAALARTLLPESIAVAAVANFPDGGTDLARVRADIAVIRAAGAQELDLVLPWRALAAGDEAGARAALAVARDAAGALTLKVILETGALTTAALVDRAAALALAEGADFLKTSTGTLPAGATPEAARRLLASLDRAGRRGGLKVSGGIRTLDDAAGYLALVRRWGGPPALEPARFRIGASSLMTAIEAALS